MEVLLALFIILITLCFDRKALSVDWGAVSKFLAFMSAFVCFVICVESFSIKMNGIRPTNTVIDGLADWTLGLVFLEDALFVIPIYLLRKFLSPNKFLWISYIVIVSLIFGSGHLYQGTLAAMILCLYPFFLSYRYGIKFGFGTVMICHVLYDHIIVYTHKILPILLH
jgi:hypothetical protein